MREANKTPESSWKTLYLLKPESFIRFLWEIFVGIFLLFLGFSIPYLNAFEPENSSLSQTIDNLSLAIFSLDIFLNFNTAYYSQGEIISDRLKIMKNYLLFWFWLDLLTTLPIDSIFLDSSSSSSSQALKYVKLVRIFKLIKLLRLAKLRILIFRIEDQISNQDFIHLLSVLKLVVYIFLIAHFLACLMFSLSASDLSPTTFLSLILNKSDEKIYNPGELYVSSLYWAMTTMSAVGYGDISPVTINEKLFGMITMLMSSLVFGIIIGNIGSILEKSSKKEKFRAEVLVSLNRFFKDGKVRNDLQAKARRYINYSFFNEDMSGLNPSDILSTLSQPLQEEIILYTSGTLLLSYELFKTITGGYLNRFAKLLRIKIFSPVDPIITESQIPEGIYFIVKGKVEVYDSITSHRLKILKKNEFFGEIGMFSRQTCVASVISQNYVETLFMSIIDFDKEINQLIELKNLFDEIRGSCTENNYMALYVRCYCCGQLGHIAKHCQVLINDEEFKAKWIQEKNEPTLVNLYAPIQSKIQRKLKKVKINRYSSKNILGRRRKIVKMFPMMDRLFKSIKHYLIQQNEQVVGYDALHTEETILNSETFFNSNRVKMILTSSDEDEIQDNAKNHSLNVIRNPTFNSFDQM